MEVFITAVNKLIIIFLLVLIGCFAKKKDIIDDCFIDKFSGFLTKIVVPCFIHAAVLYTGIAAERYCGFCNLYDYAYLGHVGRLWNRQALPRASYESGYLGVQLYVC